MGKALEHLGPDKVPENFRYQEARQFFQECDAVDTSKVEFDFKDPDIEGLKKFLVEECTFNEQRVDRFMDRLKAAKSRTKQRPLDSFFGRAKVEVRDEEKFDPSKKKARAKGGAAGAKAVAKRKAGAPAGGPAK